MELTVGIKGHDDLGDVINYLSADLYTAPGGASGEHLELLSAKTNEEYVRLFKKHEETLKEVLGGKFDIHSERFLSVQENAIEERSALRNLERYAPADKGTVFAVLPDYLCKDGSVFVEMAKEIYGEVLVTDTVYYDCVTLSEKSEETPRNDGSFPGFASGIRIASAKDLEGFREYFADAVNSFDSHKLSDRMKIIGDAGKDTFFIVCGSGPITYNGIEKEETGTVGTVNVAPG